MRHFIFSISLFSSLSFLELLTTPSLVNAQNVGIGTASFTPLNRLDVKGNAVIGDTYSGGNSAPANGLLVEGYVGIGNATAPEMLSVGNAAEFRVNSTGDISRIRNIPYNWPTVQGAANTVITNNGAGVLNWTSPTATLYNETYFDYNTAGVTATTAGWVNLPGMSRTITLTAPAKILCHSDGGIQTTSATTNGFSAVDCVLFINGALFGQGGYERVTVVNNLGVVTTLGFWSKEVIATLAPGTYTIDVRTRLNLGANASVGGNNASVLQGVLITQVIYQ
jgi:hypothetical protein